jgi:phosphoenolpyruvate carboxylase
VTVADVPDTRSDALQSEVDLLGELLFDVLAEQEGPEFPRAVRRLQRESL